MNLKRLWQTLNYFEVIPLISILKRPTTNYQLQTMGLILVTGATGGVGKRVVETLLKANYRVRVLVRDGQKAREMFSDRVEIWEGDLTIAETLNPKLLQDVSAVICCTGVKVRPVEGDTPTREKYYQGIKFYLPEVVDSPEMVEYKGMKNLMQVIKPHLRSDERLLFDFTNPNQDVKEFWGAVDDVVMGGVSESQIRLVRDRAIFSGNVSTANNGGFASVRTRNFSTPLDLSAYKGISLRLQGDGKRYKFIMRCEGKWDGIAYCYSFDTIYNFSQTIDIPFSELIPVVRAKTVPEAGVFDSSKIYSLQLMLSKFEYDGALNPRFAPGIFGLEVETIKAYGKQINTPQFILISSAGVTRPGRPGIDLEKEPPAVRLNDQLGGILTWKLAGEEVVRNSGLLYTIIRPCALTEKPGDKGLIFDQGDNIKGQVSREAIAQLCLQVLNNPEAVNKTFEVKETEEIAPKLDYSLGNLKID
ncbi:CIA30 family protein [Gloeocapsa sp. PCC 73106]|uniref:CIA30 family protein n=1 Tax=Gloeocapsa sp. PCC 73106 TaxID=102232 RepID=UPI0002ACD2FC|nr:CIA30 family protein [Gloeocapsa sp. PCC 73106]ELR96214.1 NmrA-like family protein [Gloeocapsa sp. PCC 73106]